MYNKKVEFMGRRKTRKDKGRKRGKRKFGSNLTVAARRTPDARKVGKEAGRIVGNREAKIGGAIGASVGNVRGRIVGGAAGTAYQAGKNARTRKARKKLRKGVI